MPKKFATDTAILYAESRGISVEAARKRISRGAADFVKWEAETRGKAVKRAPKKKTAAPKKPTVADKSLERYRELEEKTYLQLCQTQEKLDNALSADVPAEIRICSQALKDVASLYNDVVELRKNAEILAARLLPIEVLDRYKSTFYPRIEKGVEEMRMSIEAHLPDHMRADFKSAWRKSYTKYQVAAVEAENAIESVRNESRKTKIKK